ncbi:MAG: hypothetical protein JNL07_12445, partial [Rhodospirillales bacterium]|nr:hypothetical protein [Rhodospirillales bacterium]
MDWRVVTAALIAVLIVAGGYYAFAPPPSPSAPSPSQPPPAVTAAALSPATAAAATFVGAAACGQCHQDQLKAWRGSHHDMAMQEASERSVLGDFKDATLVHHGMESRFFRRGAKYMVRTEGPDGAPADFEIAYTFGVFPLQQYLVAFPGGRFQALTTAWDSRPKDEGGQRW